MKVSECLLPRQKEKGGMTEELKLDSIQDSTSKLAAPNSCLLARSGKPMNINMIAKKYFLIPFLFYNEHRRAFRLAQFYFEPLRQRFARCFGNVLIIE